MRKQKVKFTLELEGSKDEVRGKFVSLFSAISESLERNSGKPITFFLRERLSKIEKKQFRIAIRYFINNQLKIRESEIPLSESLETQGSVANDFLEYHRRAFAVVVKEGAASNSPTVSRETTERPELDSKQKESKLSFRTLYEEKQKI